MEALHIEEDIYRQIAEYIEDNALPYIRGWHSEADEFRIDDVCFETDSAADGYQFVSVAGYGLIHYTRNTSGGEFSREFDSLGQCWLAMISTSINCVNILSSYENAISV